MLLAPAVDSVDTGDRQQGVPRVLAAHQRHQPPALQPHNICIAVTDNVQYTASWLLSAINRHFTATLRKLISTFTPLVYAVSELLTCDVGSDFILFRVPSAPSGAIRLAASALVITIGVFI